MKSVVLKAGIPFLCAAMIFTACGYNQGANQRNANNQGNTQSTAQGNNTKMNGIGANNGTYNRQGNKPENHGDGSQSHPGTQGNGVNNQAYGQGSTVNIPSYDPHGDTDHFSTSNYTNQSYALGTSVFSIIGSSGLHEGGVSAHVQSRIQGAGVNGIDVLVLDDSVILAQKSSEISATHYDPMQDKLLNGTSGTSATGVERRADPSGATNPAVQNDSVNGTYGTSGTGQTSMNNLDVARKQVSDMFGGNVTILTVTDKSAVQAVSRVKAEMKSANVSSDKISKDIALILKNAKKTK